MEPTAPVPAAVRRFLFWRRLFEPAPAAAAPLTEPAAIRQGYRRWQRRVLFSTIITTLLFAAAWGAKADGYPS